MRDTRALAAALKAFSLSCCELTNEREVLRLTAAAASLVCVSYTTKRLSKYTKFLSPERLCGFVYRFKNHEAKIIYVYCYLKNTLTRNKYKLMLNNLDFKVSQCLEQIKSLKL